MPSSYSTNLKIELQATGENSGTWGTITNTNLGTALEQAVVGYGNPSYPSDANLTLTYTDTNAAQAARALVLNVTSAVSLSATRELVVPTIQKQYIVQNNTSGSQSITVKTSAGTGITVPNGRKAHLYVNGTDVIFMDDYVDINGGSIDGTTIGANSAAAGNFTTVDTTNIEVTNLKAKDGTTAGSIADATGVVTLGSSVLTTTDINGGTIDGTTIGGSSAAAGTFTTLTTSSTVTLSGGTANGVLYLNGSKVATSGTALVFDGTNLGVGAASGTSSGYATAPQLLNYSASATNLLNASDTSSIIRSAAYRDTTGGGIISMAKFRGTYASPTVVQSGDTSGRLFFDVWGGSNLRRIAEVGALVDTYTSDTNISGTLYFATSTSGNSSSTEKMRLTAAGDLGIGTASPAAKLDVTGFARTTTGAVFQGASNLASGAGLEVGYNTGSSYSFLQSYDRTGSAYRAIRLVGSTIDFDIANSVKATIDSSGNLGIGTASPEALLHLNKATAGGAGPYLMLDNSSSSTLNSSAGISFSLDAGSSFAGYSARIEGINTNAVNGASDITFSTWNGIARGERARITSGGDLLVGATATVQSSRAEFTSTSLAPAFLARVNANSDEGQWAGQFQKKTNTSTTSQIFVRFLINDGATASGYITANGANAATFTSSSDARLKENIVDLPPQLSNILALKPVEFDYKDGSGHQIGFIAQDLQEVYPDCVSEGTDGMLQIGGWSKTEARLVKALQEAMARIESLEAKVTALESK
jgi:hypothetical protein